MNPEESDVPETAVIAPQAIAPQAIAPQAIAPQAIVPQAIVPQAIAPVIPYQGVQVEPAGSRPWWVYGVCGFYLLIVLLLLTLPFWTTWFDGNNDSALPAALFAGSLIGCGVALMILPVKVARRTT